MKKKYGETPLVLVFYIDREMMVNRAMITPFVESINELIEKKNANIIALFLPCDEGQERVEAINPIILEKPDVDRVNRLIEDIQTKFSIGADINLPDIEIGLNNNKECVCGNNPNGDCECKNKIQL